MASTSLELLRTATAVGIVVVVVVVVVMVGCRSSCTDLNTVTAMTRSTKLLKQKALERQGLEQTRATTAVIINPIVIVHKSSFFFPPRTTITNIHILIKTKEKRTTTKTTQTRTHSLAKDM
jgi:hypothetical protein